MTIRREIAQSRGVAPIAPQEQWVPGAETRPIEAYLKQYVEGESGEPTRLHAVAAACRLVAAANPGYPLLLRNATGDQ